MKSRKSTLAPLLAAIALSLGLVACGGGDSSSSTGSVSSGGEDSGSTESEVADVSGDFELLATTLSGYEGLAGEAELERRGGTTTTSIELTGLEPNTEYMAHLHVAGCDAADPGGPHFKFDPQGSEEPPNEIHLGFESNPDGEGGDKVVSDGEVPVGEAGSVVLHLTGSHHKMAALLVHGGKHHGEAGEDGDSQAGSDKIACAELEGGEVEADGQGASGEATGAVPTVVVKNGEPVGGVAELEFDSGEQIRFKVKGDEAEEIHLHGYDVMEEIPDGGGTVEFDLPAEIEGIFEAELEGQGVQIAEIVVNP